MNTTASLDDTSVQYFYNQHINTPAIIASWITFIILTCVLNVLVIALIIYVYVRRPASRLRSPQHLVILACCLVQVLMAVGPDALTVHLHRAQGTGRAFRLGCHALLAWELSAYLLPAVVRMLVGSVVFTEAVHKFFTLTARGRTTLGIVSVAMSVLYGVLVIIPVFYTMLLRDSAKPCVMQGGVEFVNWEYNLNKVRAMPVVDFVIPHCFVLLSCMFLLVAIVTRRRAKLGVYVQFDLQASNAGVGFDDGGLPIASERSQHSNHTCPPANHTCPPANTSTNRRVFGQSTTTKSHQPHPFPLYAVLAATVSFLFGLAFCFYQLADKWELGLTYQQIRQLWLASTLLVSLSGVFLPACWLLQRDLLAVWWCRPHKQGEPDFSLHCSPQHSDMSMQVF